MLDGVQLHVPDINLVDQIVVQVHETGVVLEYSDVFAGVEILYYNRVVESLFEIV